MASLNIFKQYTTDWFTHSLGTPTAVQETAWLAIAAGEHTLVSFGAEPKDYEVNQFILENYDKLRFSPSVVSIELEERINPIETTEKEREAQGQITAFSL